MAHLANLVMTPEIQIRKNSHCNCKQPILDRADLSVFSGSDVYNTRFNWMSCCSEKKKRKKAKHVLLFCGASSQLVVVHTAETSNTTEGGYNSYF